MKSPRANFSVQYDGSVGGWRWMVMGIVIIVIAVIVAVAR